MYRPPENANRVQAIRNIFEKKEVTTPPKLITKSKTELDLRYSRCHQNLNRQLSDPSKRSNNIKRTPAFRLDKNAVVEKNHPNRYHHHTKVKHDCDKVKSNDASTTLNFSDIRSKFSCNQSNTSEMTSTNVKNLSFLYAEPIPKALRVKKCDTLTPKSDYCNQETLKLESLTDTLKSALKKPLPTGPAPKKPPRTFLHSPGAGQTSKIDKKFTDTLNKKLQNSPTPRGKGDPKYMLDKLENMLKSKHNRIIRKTDSEDSDDANTLPNNNNNSPSLFNCLNALGCSASSTTTYECIREPNCTFFVDEPVYAEPFQQKEKKKSNKEQRSSLYYMVCLCCISLID